MSPSSPSNHASRAVDVALRRIRADFGRQVRDARTRRRWSTSELGSRAGLSRWVVYLAERGDSISLDAMARLGEALGLRLEVDLVDTRRRNSSPGDGHWADMVHSAMGEFEATHFRPFGLALAIDEPYQHYQFAGRADFIACDLQARALLHIENRTRFPDIQEALGSFNAKRAYLGDILAERLGVRGWQSETHVMAVLWSAEVLHSVRLRMATFQSVCSDPSEAFIAWWMGQPPTTGRRSILVAMDPLASPRQRPFVGIDEIKSVRPRYRGYAQAASAMMRRRE